MENEWYLVVVLTNTFYAWGFGISLNYLKRMVAALNLREKAQLYIPRADGSVVRTFCTSAKYINCAWSCKTEIQSQHWQLALSCCS